MNPDTVSRAIDQGAGILWNRHGVWGRIHPEIVASVYDSWKLWAVAADKFPAMVTIPIAVGRFHWSMVTIAIAHPRTIGTLHEQQGQPLSEADPASESETGS